MKRRLIGLAAAAALASFGRVCPAADFDGDGTGEIAVFKPSGLWSVRGLTRIYLGTGGDIPVPGNYGGESADRAAIFRGAGGLWSVRDLTRVYFGGSGDLPKPGDYDGDGRDDIATFRESAGLWAVRNLTRVYFGGSGDTAIPPGQAGGSRACLLTTGQTTSYWSGDDGTSRKGVAFSYQTSDPAGNGEIVTTDKVTGLMWASDGDAEGCNFGNQTVWDGAVDWAEGLTFAGYSDWRLPNFRELHSLVDYGTHDPAINTAYFWSSQPYEYWSGSSSYWLPGTYAWRVDFSDGNVRIYTKSTAIWVRAVRVGK